MKEKVIGLVSGGIDSPVANLIVAKKFDLTSLHFCLYPLTAYEDAMKSFEVLEKVQEKTDSKNTIIFPQAGILKEIQKRVKDEYACLACRRSMLVTASELCKQEGAKGIVTGEALGQKASQTLENIIATSIGINFPVIRPLIGLNKDEIINRSKDFGIWNPDHAGCCLTVPENPRTKAKVRDLDREMEKIDVKNLIEDNMEFSLKINNFDFDFDDYLSDLSKRFD